jgi:hypothetical protein
MIQNQKLGERAENTGILIQPEIEWLLQIIGEISPEILDWEKISPKRLIWPPIVLWEEERKESIRLILPERLTNPQYGSADLDQHLRELAKKAPGIEKIWEITKDLPSLTDLIIEERENE